MAIRELDREPPERVAALPRDDRGYPIPWIAYVGPDGKPDFRILDEEKRRQALASRLCSICGSEMGYWVWFIGGPGSMAGRLFNDPAMHEECARYALDVCPFLSRDVARYRPNPTDAPEGVVFASLPSADHRPEKIGLGMTRGYSPVVIKGVLTIKADKFKSIKWMGE